MKRMLRASARFSFVNSSASYSLFRTASSTEGPFPASWPRIIRDTNPYSFSSSALLCPRSPPPGELRAHRLDYRAKSCQKWLPCVPLFRSAAARRLKVVERPSGPGPVLFGRLFPRRAGPKKKKWQDRGVGFLSLPDTFQRHMLANLSPGKEKLEPFHTGFTKKCKNRLATFYNRQDKV